MKISNMKSILKHNWIFYLICVNMIVLIKFFYNLADSNALLWILTPTTWWVSFLSDIPFKYVSQVGYINHSFELIIAPSCSGVQFMLITFATLLCSFVHRMKTTKGGIYWLGLSLGFSYIYTIIINGFRIVTSIYLPDLLKERGFNKHWLNPEKLHSMIGIVVYFTSLLFVFYITECAMNKILTTSIQYVDPAHSRLQLIRKFISPVLWYFSFTLGIPFIHRIYKNDWVGFVDYTLLIIGLCLAIVLLLLLILAVRRSLLNRNY